MRIYISHITALFFWRQRAVEDFATFPRSKKRILSDCCTTARESEERVPISVYFGPGRKHVLVPNTPYRVNEAQYRYHVLSAKLPPRSLIELDEHIYVSSPEFCFLQMAAILSVAGLIALGLELCGAYRLQFGASAIYHCPPLTTPTRLLTFVQNAKGFYGQKKALRALRWILAGSASPRETWTFERLCLSNHLGGYAFSFPQLNGEMPFNEHQQELAERSTSYGDLYWPEQDVVVEYFGIGDHSSPHDMNSDAKRDNALIARKTRFYTITDDIYSDMGKFDVIAREIASALGLRINTRISDLAVRNWQLMKELEEQEKLTHSDSEDDSDETGTATR